EDIAKIGLTQPIIFWREHPKAQAQLLDGRSRLDAIEMTHNLPPITSDDDLVQAIGTKGVRWCDPEICDDPFAYAASLNLHRRHLTGEQKRDLIIKLIKPTPGKSNRQIAETVTASPTTVGTVRAEMEVKGLVSKLDTRRDRRGREQPTTKPPA